MVQSLQPQGSSVIIVEISIRDRTHELEVRSSNHAGVAGCWSRGHRRSKKLPDYPAMITRGRCKRCAGLDGGPCCLDSRRTGRALATVSRAVERARLPSAGRLLSP